MGYIINEQKHQNERKSIQSVAVQTIDRTWVDKAVDSKVETLRFLGRSEVGKAVEKNTHQLTPIVVITYGDDKTLLDKVNNCLEEKQLKTSIIFYVIITHQTPTPSSRHKLRGKKTFATHHAIKPFRRYNIITRI